MTDDELMKFDGCRLPHAIVDISDIMRYVKEACDTAYPLDYYKGYVILSDSICGNVGEWVEVYVFKRKENSPDSRSPMLKRYRSCKKNQKLYMNVFSFVAEKDPEEVTSLEAIDNGEMDNKVAIEKAHKAIDSGIFW